MASVFVHVGQCGNQLGSSFHQLVHQGKETGSLFESYDGKLHSVHVDGEKKVIKGILAGKNKLPVRESNVITRKQGCASNWAMGYCGPRAEQSNFIVQESAEIVRKEVERCDRFGGFILMHSLGGGTGSGAGSCLIETLRDEYPMAHMLSCAVAPHRAGESPLQHYNSLLSLVWLQRYTDGVILVQNDDILNCIMKLRESQHSKESIQVSVKDMNLYIAQSLAGILLPVDDLNPIKGIYSGQEPWEMLHSICPMPSCKFLSVKHLIKSKASWDSITKSLVHSTRKYDSTGKPFSSLSNLVIARGDLSGSFMSSLHSIQKIVQAGYHSVPWNPYPVDFWMSSRQEFMRPGEASITICSNSSSVVEFAQHAHDKAKAMYDANAYIHWYEKYCPSIKDILMDAFSEAQDIIDNYNAAVR